MVNDYYEQIVQFLATGTTPEYLTTSQKKQLVVKATDFQLIARQLYKLGPDEILRRCVIPHEQGKVLVEAHAGVVGGQYGGCTTTRKLLHAELWWSTLNSDATDYVQTHDVY